MQKYRIEDFTRGWLIGDFEPSLMRTKDFEVMVRYYKAGEIDKKHVHKVAQEMTIIVSGKFKANGQVVGPGDIYRLQPGEAMTEDFECLEDGANVVIKTPSVIGDKYPA